MRFNILLLILAWSVAACTSQPASRLTPLRDTIDSIIAGAPAHVGVAVIADDGDTLEINPSADYPLMSMFKLPEAMAVCRIVSQTPAGLDSLITVRRSELDLHTWSPMLNDYPDSVFDISLRRLVEYILIDSDNNASNLLFDRIVSVAATDSIVRGMTADGRFVLRHRESDMQRRHELSYDNVASPMAYARIIESLYNPDAPLDSVSRAFIIGTMGRCRTGMDRIAAGLPDSVAVSWAHRTGSGYINARGEVVAVNDGGRVTLPDGSSYIIVILVRDYAGPQPDAERLMARISDVVYRHIVR